MLMATPVSRLTFDTGFPIVVAGSTPSTPINDVTEMTVSVTVSSESYNGTDFSPERLTAVGIKPLLTRLIPLLTKPSLMLICRDLLTRSPSVTISDASTVLWEMTSITNVPSSIDIDVPTADNGCGVDGVANTVGETGSWTGGVDRPTARRETDWATGDVAGPRCVTSDVATTGDGETDE